MIFLADPKVDESKLPPQFHGDLRTVDAKRLIEIAFGELHLRKSAHNLREVNIIVYQRSENHAPSISEIGVKPALDFVSRLLEE